MLRQPALIRLLAAFLAGLLALPAGAAAPKAKVVILPYAVLPGVPESAAGRLAEQLAQELRGRGELKLVELKARRGRPSADPAAQARATLGKAARLAQQSQHAAAADALQKAIALLGSNPAAIDEATGKLLADAALQLAVERLVSGDEDGGEAALAQLVRLAPERELNPADYPPAFLVELRGVKKRLLAAPRGSLQILAAPGAGETRVLVDGRPAPALVQDLVPGEHFVRVERGGVGWGQKVIAIAGVTTRVAPQPGVEGPAAELTGALLLGELDRAAVMTAGRLARAAGAQAAVFGAVVKSGGGVIVRSFLCLAKGDRVAELSPLELDAELLGGMVKLVKVGDDVAAKLASPPVEPALPISIEGPARAAPPAAKPEAPAALPGAKPETPAVPLAPLVAADPLPAAAAPPSAPEPARKVALPVPPPAAAAPDPARRVLVPGAPAAPAPAPAREAVVVAIAQARPAAAAVPVKAVEAAPARRLPALEPDLSQTVREPPPRSSHTALWIVAGVLVTGAAAAGGYFLYQSGQTPTTANVNATWGH